jgi:hypothetical protein
VTIASPAVWTRAGHGFVANRPVRLTTTGALPTGFTAGTVYYVRSPTTNTFQLSATPGGAALNATGTQSGVHTVTDAETMYFARIDNPDAVYNIHCPSVNNFGGFSECTGVSIVRAKQVNVNGAAFEGMRNTVVVEATQTVAGSVNIVGCQDLSQVPGARSLVVGLVSKPTNTRIGGLAGAPITASISSTVRAMLTNRRPSRPIVSSGTALRGPALTNSEVGAEEYAASTASPVVSAEWNTCCRPLNPAKPSNPTTPVDKSMARDGRMFASGQSMRTVRM